MYQRMLVGFGCSIVGFAGILGEKPEKWSIRMVFLGGILSGLVLLAGIIKDKLSRKEG